MTITFGQWQRDRLAERRDEVDSAYGYRNLQPLGSARRAAANEDLAMTVIAAVDAGYSYAELAPADAPAKAYAKRSAATSSPAEPMTDNLKPIPDGAGPSWDDLMEVKKTLEESPAYTTFPKVDAERWGRMLAVAVERREASRRRYLEDCHWVGKMIAAARADGHTYAELARQSGVQQRALSKLARKHTPKGTD